MTSQQEVYLAIGGNTSPRKKFIIDSLAILKKTFPQGFHSSCLYLTEPFLRKVQPYYYNCCVLFFSDIQSDELLKITSSIELSLGRERDGTKWQTRTIDIDILLVGQQVVEKPNLAIPHYDLLNRDFFLIPLLELNNDLTYPLTGKALSDYLEEIPEEKRTHPLKLFKPTYF
ncbi:2-amino-4-hydroxy-6-hydroxymethyldihydropteridine diphosphokinase [bacterium]|nr:2-amino-4-hydroxy-6-hydroxymethyldihydropteridine diphosphokinase [bacterium]